jgi:hypothetical protein
MLAVFLGNVLRLLVTANIPSSPILVTLMMEAICSSKTSVITRATQRNVPEDCILHNETLPSNCQCRFLVLIRCQVQICLEKTRSKVYYVLPFDNCFINRLGYWHNSWTYIWEQVLNLSWQSDYPYRFLWFSSVPPSQFQDSAPCYNHFLIVFNSFSYHSAPYSLWYRKCHWTCTTTERMVLHIMHWWHQVVGKYIEFCMFTVARLAEAAATEVCHYPSGR